MTSWQDIRRSPSEYVTVRTIWVAVALSLLVHLAALLVGPPAMPVKPKETLGVDGAKAPLAVRLAEARPPAPAPAPPPQPASPTVRPPARIARPAVPRTAPPPPLAAPRSPLPAPVPVPAPPLPATVATPPAPVAGDLAAYVASRRQARGATDSPASAATVDDEKARRDRALAANIATINAAPQGDATRNSGGVFQITRLGYDDAEFLFFGWHKEAGRRLTQKYEVRRDRDGDIRTAVVRRMIAIIREYEQEQFLWRSQKLGDVTLSAPRRQRGTRALFHAGLLRRTGAQSVGRIRAVTAVRMPHPTPSGVDPAARRRRRGSRVQPVQHVVRAHLAALEHQLEPVHARVVGVRARHRHARRPACPRRRAPTAPSACTARLDVSPPITPTRRSGCASSTARAARRRPRRRRAARARRVARAPCARAPTAAVQHVGRRARASASPRRRLADDRVDVERPRPGTERRVRSTRAARPRPGARSPATGCRRARTPVRRRGAMGAAASGAGGSSPRARQCAISACATLLAPSASSGVAQACSPDRGRRCARGRRACTSNSTARARRASADVEPRVERRASSGAEQCRVSISAMSVEAL